jgi:serine/threonine protein kinase HipA of HipAB toxin-antitoxin module
LNLKVRQDLVQYAFDSRKRLIKNGLTPKQSREAVERDYELVEAEKILLNNWMLSEQK